MAKTPIERLIDAARAVVIADRLVMDVYEEKAHGFRKHHAIAGRAECLKELRKAVGDLGSVSDTETDNRPTIAS